MITCKDVGEYYEFKCRVHGHHLIPKVKLPNKSWTFNGNFEKPTFTPSVNCSWTFGDEEKFHRCHFVITDGIINYCSDCTHELAGQSLALEPYTEAEAMNHPVSENQ